MWDVLSYIWHYKISLTEIFTPLFNYSFSPLPILATYLVFDSTAIVRRLTKTAYVPMYFMFFPTGHSDRLYTQYFGEDDHFDEGTKLTPTQKKIVRTRIVRTAIFSTIFATVVAPYLCGFLAALYLQPQQFNEFLIFLLIVKGILILKALKLLRHESMVSWDDRVFGYVLAMYGLYLVFVYYGLTEAYDWTSANLHNYSIPGLIAAFFRYLYLNLILGIVFVTMGTWAVSDKFIEIAEKVQKEREN